MVLGKLRDKFGRIRFVLGENAHGDGLHKKTILTLNIGQFQHKTLEMGGEQYILFENQKSGY